MVNKKWVRIKWYGLPSIRYLFIIMPNGERAIIDHWSGINILNYIPFVRRYQRFNAYIIPKETDISGWEKYLTSELDMVSVTTKIVTGSILLKLLGGGIIGGGIIVLLNLAENPLNMLLKFLHIPPSIFIVVLSLSLWLFSNFISKRNIQKKIP